MIFNTIPSTVNQVTLNKQLITYPAQFLTATAASAMCRTNGYLGYNLVFVCINTGTPPTIAVYNIANNYEKIATISMPSGCTNITQCLFNAGVLYVVGGTASNSGIYKMTFAGDSTVSAPIFDVSALIYTDGTTAISNVSVGHSILLATIGENTRIITTFTTVAGVLTYISSYDIASTSSNFNLVQTHGSGSTYYYGFINKTPAFVLNSDTYYLIYTATYLGLLYRFPISSSFIVDIPDVPSNAYKITTVLANLVIQSSDSNYIYFTTNGASYGKLIRILISDIVTLAAIPTITASNTVFLTNTNMAPLAIKVDNYFVVIFNIATYQRLAFIDLSTFTLSISYYLANENNTKWLLTNIFYNGVNYIAQTINPTGMVVIANPKILNP